MLLDKVKVELAMARKGLNRAELAKTLDVADLTVSKYFRQGRVLNPKTVGKLAKALEVDPSEIIKREE